MWHLEKPSSQELEQYVGWLMPMIKKRINDKRKAGHYLIWCAYLLPDDKHDKKIYDVLVAEPEELIRLKRLVKSDLNLTIGLRILSTLYLD